MSQPAQNQGPPPVQPAPSPPMEQEIVTDRLTQLQDKVDAVAEKFFSFVGVLQRDAPPVPLDGSNGLRSVYPPPTQQQIGPGGEMIIVPPPPTLEQMYHVAEEMSRHLIANSKEIDLLIESLPGINSTKPQQLATLEQLERQNQEATEQLRDTLTWAENSLALVREALQEIFSDRQQQISDSMTA